MQDPQGWVSLSPNKSFRTQLTRKLLTSCPWHLAQAIQGSTQTLNLSRPSEVLRALGRTHVHFFLELPIQKGCATVKLTNCQAPLSTHSQNHPQRPVQANGCKHFEKYSCFFSIQRLHGEVGPHPPPSPFQLSPIASSSQRSFQTAFAASQ